MNTNLFKINYFQKNNKSYFGVFIDACLHTNFATKVFQSLDAFNEFQIEVCLRCCFEDSSDNILNLQVSHCTSE